MEREGGVQGGFGPIQDLKSWRKAALEQIGDRTVVCSISGGKDSTAMALLLKEVEIPFVSVHLDTGWEHALTDAYVREYLPGVVGPIEILRRDRGGMVSLVKEQAGFPGGNQRFCTRELKIRPMQRYLNAMESEPINTVGIRGGESFKRSLMPEWEESETFRCLVWRPIKPWSEEDVFAMHHRHGVKLNPLYGMGAGRVGCWPCVYARKAEIRMLADLDPERVALLRKLEEAVQTARDDRNVRRGKAEGGVQPTWFAHKLADWPIDEVIAWSRSELSATQWRSQEEGDLKQRLAAAEPELFDAPPHEQGCMRWGLCETSATDASPTEEAEADASALDDLQRPRDLLD